jgi:hypothetical protein
MRSLRTLASVCGPTISPTFGASCASVLWGRPSPFVACLFATTRTTKSDRLLHKSAARLARRSAVADNVISMRAVLIAALLLPVLAIAQKLADPSKVANSPGFERRAREPTLRCEVTPIKPALNFALRLQAGYTVNVPLDQYSGAGHSWTVLIRVTPAGEPPVDLVDFIDLPPVPETKSDGQATGGYLLGEGRYTARLALSDDSGRVCRKEWRIDAACPRNTKLNIAPGAVADLALQGLPDANRQADAIAPMRLTVLLDAAPQASSRNAKAVLTADDQALLLAMLLALLERVPTISVRLVVFNLEEQKEVFRREGFTIEDLSEVSRAIGALQPGVVDYRVLQNPNGPRDLILSLISQEMRVESPSDAALFLGPHSRYIDKFPLDAPQKPQSGGPQFFYLDYRPFPGAGRFRRGRGPRGGYNSGIRRAGTDSNFPDIISRAVEKVKGKTIAIHSPAEFSRAIAEIERRTAKREQ